MIWSKSSVPLYLNNGHFACAQDMVYKVDVCSPLTSLAQAHAAPFCDDCYIC